MSDPQITAALAPLEGEWFWHFSEQPLPVMPNRRLVIGDGHVRDGHRDCAVTLGSKGVVNIGFPGGKSVLRILPGEEVEWSREAEDWEGGRYLEPAFIVRAEHVGEAFEAGES